jgi:hypothetical protein
MQTLLDFAGRPEYVAPLRKELQDIMAEEGDRHPGPKVLAKLVKMDSFLKESQRHVAQNIRTLSYLLPSSINLPTDAKLQFPSTAKLSLL